MEGGKEIGDWAGRGQAFYDTRKRGLCGGTALGKGHGNAEIFQKPKKNCPPLQKRGRMYARMNRGSTSPGGRRGEGQS